MRNAFSTSTSHASEQFAHRYSHLKYIQIGRCFDFVFFLWLLLSGHIHKYRLLDVWPKWTRFIHIAINHHRCLTGLTVARVLKFDASLMYAFPIIFILCVWERARAWTARPNWIKHTFQHHESPNSSNNKRALVKMRTDRTHFKLGSQNIIIICYWH